MLGSSGSGRVASQGAVPVAGTLAGGRRSPDDHRCLIGDWSRPLPVVKRVSRRLAWKCKAGAKPGGDRHRACRKSFCDNWLCHHARCRFGECRFRHVAAMQHGVAIGRHHAAGLPPPHLRSWARNHLLILPCDRELWWREGDSSQTGKAPVTDRQSTCHPERSEGSRAEVRRGARSFATLRMTVSAQDDGYPVSGYAAEYSPENRQLQQRALCHASLLPDSLG